MPGVFVRLLASARLPGNPHRQHSRSATPTYVVSPRRRSAGVVGSVANGCRRSWDRSRSLVRVRTFDPLRIYSGRHIVIGVPILDEHIDIGSRGNQARIQLRIGPTRSQRTVSVVTGDLRRAGGPSQSNLCSHRQHYSSDVLGASAGTSHSDRVCPLKCADAHGDGHGGGAGAGGGDGVRD